MIRVGEGVGIIKGNDIEGDTEDGIEDAVDEGTVGDGGEGDGGEGERPLSAGESLALIEREQPQIHRRLVGNIVMFYAPWGAAYLLGFGAVFMTYDTALPWRLPGAVAAVVIAMTFGAAMVAAVVTATRSGRGVHGPSRLVGAMYGWCWPLGFTTLTVVNVKVAGLGVPPDAATLLWSGSSLLLVGVLYLAGGALWQDRFQYSLGVWMLVTAAASVLAGVPGNFAVLALAGGGGLLLTAAYHLARWPRASSPS